jgi:hypothetical protein
MRRQLAGKPARRYAFVRGHVIVYPCGKGLSKT